MDRELEMICWRNTQERRIKETVNVMALLKQFMVAERKRQKKRKEMLRQYRWWLAGVRVGRFLLLLMSAGLAWIGSNAWAAGGVLAAALFLLAEFDLQGKIEDLRRDEEC